ncbi:MAG: hypothetical protein ACYTG7_04330 [Planctomycetota bacterium]
MNSRSTLAPSRMTKRIIPPARAARTYRGALRHSMKSANSLAPKIANTMNMGVT